MTEPLTVPVDSPTSADGDFARFYERWHPSVYRWALQRYGATYADEIAQETLSRAFVNFRRLRRDVPWPWLLTVARNVACDLRRHDRRCTAVPDDGLPEQADPCPGPEEIAEWGEASAQLRDAIRAMPAADRLVLTMSVDDMTIAQMADALGATPGAVRMKLHRARRRLGHLYASAGRLAVAPFLGAAWLVRRSRRTLQQAVVTTAPTTAALAATAAVVTLGVVVVSIPSVTIGSAQVRPAAVRHPVRAAAAVTHGKAGAAARAVRAGSPHAASGGASGYRATAATPPAAPVAAVASADVNKNPTRPGKLDDIGVGVSTPAGDVTITNQGIRQVGSGLSCALIARHC